MTDLVASNGSEFEQENFGYITPICSSHQLFNSIMFEMFDASNRSLDVLRD
jgi:hypothetical protein